MDGPSRGETEMLKKWFCRHKEQYPARIGRSAHWQCARCDKFCGVIR